MVCKRTVSIRALAAPADGIAPALLVTVGQGILGVRSMVDCLTDCWREWRASLLAQILSQAQYLINVPEGLSKLALEHKCRPDASLKAAICLGNPVESTAGMGGLLLRLRDDGHAALAIRGGQGICTIMAALGNIVSSKYPVLDVQQVTSGSSTALYEDQHVRMVGIWSTAAASTTQQQEEEEQVGQHAGNPPKRARVDAGIQRMDVGVGEGVGTGSGRGVGRGGVRQRVEAFLKQHGGGGGGGHDMEDDCSGSSEEEEEEGSSSSSMSSQCDNNSGDNNRNGTSDNNNNNNNNNNENRNKKNATITPGVSQATLCGVVVRFKDLCQTVAVAACRIEIDIQAIQTMVASLMHDTQARELCCVHMTTHALWHTSAYQHMLHQAAVPHYVIPADAQPVMHTQNTQAIMNNNNAPLNSYPPLNNIAPSQWVSRIDQHVRTPQHLHAPQYAKGYWPIESVGCCAARSTLTRLSCIDESIYGAAWVVAMRESIYGGAVGVAEHEEEEQEKQTGKELQQQQGEEQQQQQKEKKQQEEAEGGSVNGSIAWSKLGLLQALTLEPGQTMRVEGGQWWDMHADAAVVLGMDYESARAMHQQHKDEKKEDDEEKKEEEKDGADETKPQENNQKTQQQYIQEACRHLHAWRAHYNAHTHTHSHVLPGPQHQPRPPPGRPPPAPPPGPPPTNTHAAAVLRQRMLHNTPNSTAIQSTVQPPHGTPPTTLHAAKSPIPPPHTLPSTLTHATPPALLHPALHDGQVVFLGTGSAEPSKYRGSSGILVWLQGRVMLLDCGEGCWGALLRQYGPQRAQHIVSSLELVWISHRHADHALGLLPLLTHRSSNTHPLPTTPTTPTPTPPSAAPPPLKVVGPHSVLRWLGDVCASHPHLGLHMEAHHCRVFETSAAHAHVCNLYGLCQFQSIPVHHCTDAYGLVFTHTTGFRMVYSGDTQPCPALQHAGQGATLLIHEATFATCLEHQARAKRHSTITEAMTAAQRMGAYRVVLTHFSQRYARVPEELRRGALQLAGAGGAWGDVVAWSRQPVVAFDGMVVPLTMLPVLPAVNAAVVAVLHGVDVDEEDGEG